MSKLRCVPLEKLQVWHRVIAQVAGQDEWGREVQDEIYAAIKESPPADILAALEMAKEVFGKEPSTLGYANHVCIELASALLASWGRK